MGPADTLPVALLTQAQNLLSKRSVRDLSVKGKRVLVRVDYNVPMEEKDGQTVITDDTRIRETLPTLEWLVKRGAKIILAAHLGRPKGRREPTMSLRPVAQRLSDWMGCSVAFADDCIGAGPVNIHDERDEWAGTHTSRPYCTSGWPT